MLPEGFIEDDGDEGIPTTGVVVMNGILLEGGIDFILLEGGADKLLLEG